LIKTGDDFGFSENILWKWQRNLTRLIKLLMLMRK
jgi:hypothetical protein